MIGDLVQVAAVARHAAHQKEGVRGCDKPGATEIRVPSVTVGCLATMWGYLPATLSPVCAGRLEWMVLIGGAAVVAGYGRVCE